MTSLDIALPEKLIDVFTGPADYRGAYGGRGSGKTRSFAKMAAVRGLMFAKAGTSGLIVCAREFMNSLADSSFAEVKAAIESEPWLRSNYEIGRNYIRTLDGRVEFAFIGLRHNLESTKSKARILILWVDEAEEVSEIAWQIAEPTVREEVSEIWVTWNPKKEHSATDNRFRQKPPPDSKIVELNFADNPWFPDKLRKLMEREKRRDFESYNHVWLGKYQKRSNALVFKNWRIEEFETPDDARFYHGADWGFSVDPTVLVRCFIDGEKLYIDREAVEVGCQIIHTPALFAGSDRNHPPRWENPKGHPGIDTATRWPITADSARSETIAHMRTVGFNINPAVKGKGSIEDGIAFLQNYDIIVHPRCTYAISELGSYSYKVDKNTDEVLPQLEDDHNHIIDSMRYALEGLRRSLKDRIPAVGPKLITA